MAEAVAPAHALGARVMTVAHDVWTTDHSTRYAANDRAGRSCDHSAGACTDGDALQRSGLRHEGRGRQHQYDHSGFERSAHDQISFCSMSTDSGNAPKTKPFLQLASHAGYISGQFCSHATNRKSGL
jgi:hypothetical protein